MPADSDAAGKSKPESKNNPLDFGNTNDTPGQRMKELVNLDSFKNSITNVCQLWLSGLPAPPRRYEQWHSKIVQREKISFVDTALTRISPTDAPTTVSMSTTTAMAAPNTVSVMQSSLNNSLVNVSKSAPADSSLPSTRNVSSRRNKRKEPDELLEELFKHTNDPLPEYEIDVVFFFIHIQSNPFRRIFIIFRLSTCSTGWIEYPSYFFLIFACSHSLHVLSAMAFEKSSIWF